VQLPAGPVNRTFSSAYAGVPDAVAGDYVVVDLGARHFAPTSGDTGAAIHFTDDAASDLPEDEATGTNLRSWIEFCA
jgi:hypothetical protein